MARRREADGVEIVHCVRVAPRNGLLIQTRCGIHVVRDGRLRTNYRTQNGGEITAAPVGSLKVVTCNKCRGLLGLPLMGSWAHGKHPRPGLLKQNQTTPATKPTKE